MNRVRVLGVTTLMAATAFAATSAFADRTAPTTITCEEKIPEGATRPKLECGRAHPTRGPVPVLRL